MYTLLKNCPALSVQLQIVMSSKIMSTTFNFVVEAQQSASNKKEAGSNAIRTIVIKYVLLASICYLVFSIYMYTYYIFYYTVCQKHNYYDFSTQINVNGRQVTCLRCHTILNVKLLDNITMNYNCKYYIY